MMVSANLEKSIKESEGMLHSVTPALEAASLGIAINFWERLLENSRSINLLLQNKFINEAMVIHRLSIEHFSIVVALVEGKTTFEDLKNKDLTDIPKQAQRLQKSDTKKSSLTQENREVLKNFINRLEAAPATPSGISVYNLLDSCGLDFIYTNYCLYSLRAAHSTLLSGTSAGGEQEAEKLLADAIDILDLTNAYAKKLVGSLQKK